MLKIAFLLPILAAISPPGCASVIYSFADLPDIQFQYTSPVLITSNTAVPVANLDSCVYLAGGCGEVDFTIGSDDIVSITNPAHSGSNFFHYALGTFAASPFSGGDINKVGGTLTISGSPAAAPEPATWTTLAAALLVGFAWRAGRRNRPAPAGSHIT
jgi:hypothetical protein